ncbi:hypothetical protein [Pseudoalteromonas sp. MEBiC 03485]|uniref:hypothetical protein n=1 Tax=Pseudoalteromonas sp. MEBiC 03485 TaxID=2571103 RepID=UPI00101F7009|nr:hypothetical protein [Pseudoalteromonas sp. MEBiC 03485]RZD19599.1 hypothetical protein EVU92_20575 [Pseudoalteromonas sp. MEBiC 03485]
MANEKYIRYEFTIDDTDSDLQAISTDLLGRNRFIRMDIIRQSVLTAFLLYKDVDIVELCTKTDVRNPLNSALRNSSQRSQSFELRWYRTSDLFVHKTLGMLLQELNPNYRDAYILVLFVLGYRILQGKVGISDGLQPIIQAPRKIDLPIESKVDDIINSEPDNTVESSEQTTNETIVTSGSETQDAAQLLRPKLNETKVALAGLMKRSS